jgi:hypothetical protein
MICVEIVCASRSTPLAKPMNTVKKDNKRPLMLIKTLLTNFCTTQPGTYLVHATIENTVFDEKQQLYWEKT